MARLLWLSLWGGLLGTNLLADAIEFQVTSIGLSSYRYTYFVSNTTFELDQVLDIRFDPTLYGTLSNGVAGSDFFVLLLQPNTPPGTFGDYNAEALANNPSLAVPFSVDFIFHGSGQPGAQPFFIDQFDAKGNFVSVLDSGSTAEVPEPRSVWLAGVVFLIILSALRRRSRGSIAH